jgi:tRNA (mo5U34)-methyltransferase
MVEDTRLEIMDAINKIKWFHTIDLGNGFVTPGVDRTKAKLKKLRFPQSLSGKTFLDIGAWDGFFSFEAERRGAARVLAVDEFVWAGKAWGSKAGFETAKKILNSQVEDRLISVYDISPATIGQFDVVLFSGVLYHLEHPYLALLNVASVTKELLILETHTDLEWTRRPAIAFYPGGELRGDQTNWCGPNTLAVKAMLSCCGFSDIRVVYKDSVLWRVLRAGKLLWQHGSNPLVVLQQRRIVIHARKPTNG